MLQPGKQYRWSVEGNAANGQHHIRGATFFVAAPALRAKLAQLQASAGETPARQTLYQAVLRAMSVGGSERTAALNTKQQERSVGAGAGSR